MAEWIIGAGLAINGLGLIGCFVALWRNQQVFRFRMNLIDRISNAAQQEIDAWDGKSGPSRWRRFYDDFHKVSYDAQFLRFWKPLASFWPADSVLRKHGILN